VNFSNFVIFCENTYSLPEIVLQPAIFSYSYAACLCLGETRAPGQNLSSEDSTSLLLMYNNVIDDYGAVVGQLLLTLVVRFNLLS